MYLNEGIGNISTFIGGGRNTRTSLIMDLSSSPICFTKILKLFMQRFTGRDMSIWLTLIIVCRDAPNFTVMTRQQCAQNTVHLLDSLSIYAHDEICLNMQASL